MLDPMMARALKLGPRLILAVAASLIAAIAVADWSIGDRASLGLLYIFPMLLCGLVLNPAKAAGCALLCAFLRSCFDLPATGLELVLRFLFAAWAYYGSGFFVITLRRNRGVEEQVRLLVEDSPAAILTLDDRASVLAANRAAAALFLVPDKQILIGRSIAEYVPVLADALKVRWETAAPGLSSAAQCSARRSNGEIFLANTWFSTYSGAGGTRLAAIVVDASEEMRDREEQNLSRWLQGNRFAAAAVSHEVRNLCSAIRMVCTNLQRNGTPGQSEDMHGLATLASGLENIASRQLRPAPGERLQEVPLQHVLDDLRIVIEPAWHEIEGSVRWKLPRSMPVISGDPRGLLQAFLNLANNSLRAVQNCAERALSVAVSVEGSKAVVRFADTGPGVAAPGSLFEPFQEGAEGSGLGLYVSRALVRSYGGDLRFEPSAAGCCFAVEMQRIDGEAE